MHTRSFATLLALSCFFILGCTEGPPDAAEDPRSVDGKADGFFSKDKVDFFCRTTTWVEYSTPDFDEHYDEAFLMTVACETTERWTMSGALDAADEQCDAWAEEWGLSTDQIEVIKFAGDDRDDCHFQWNEFHRQDFEAQQLNRIERAASEYGAMGFTYIYVNNIGIEQPIVLNDDDGIAEQPQWLHRSEGVYCGFPGEGIAFLEDTESQQMRVRDLETGREAVYELDPDKAGFEFRTDAFRRADGPEDGDNFSGLTANTWLTRTADMADNHITFRSALDEPDAVNADYEVAYFKYGDGHTCSP